MPKVKEEDNVDKLVITHLVVKKGMTNVSMEDLSFWIIGKQVMIQDNLYQLGNVPIQRHESDLFDNLVF